MPGCEPVTSLRQPGVWVEDTGPGSGLPEPCAGQRKPPGLTHVYPQPTLLRAGKHQRPTEPPENWLLIQPPHCHSGNPQSLSPMLSFPRLSYPPASLP